MSVALVVEQDGNVGKITMSGRIDSSNAPALAEKLLLLVNQNLSRIVCFAHELEFISSMGLRAFVVAKQKIGKEGEIFLIGASPNIVGIFVATGFNRFILLQDSYTDSTDHVLGTHPRVDGLQDSTDQGPHRATH